MHTETDCCSPPSPSIRSPATAVAGRRFNMMALNKVMLWAVTVLAIAFLFFPKYLTRLIAPGDQQVTAEMARTELRIEGMTCDGWSIKAAQAIRQAPGVLAVKVDYENRLAIIGTQRDQPVPREAIAKSLQAIGYRGEFVE